MADVTAWIQGALETITQEFGACELAGDCPHAGIDVAAPAGTPIVSQVWGTIRELWSPGGYGNESIIDLGGGREIILGHQSGYAVPSGSQVHPGEIIGYIGSTGFSTGPHLHFEERIGGKAVDPTELLHAQGGNPTGSSPIPDWFAALFPGAEAASKAWATLQGHGIVPKVPDPTQGIADAINGIGPALAGIPTTIGHGLADAIGVGVHDAEVFAQRQLIALAVAAVVLVVLFVR